MPTVDLTSKLARQSKPGPKDTILFDKALPGFGLRIHPSGRKVWIVPARIEGRSRRSEVLNLRWPDIGEDAINLVDSKTGPRAVPLGEAARALIETLRGPGKPEAFLFPSFANGKGYYRLRHCWRVVCEDSKLGRLRLHDLRHTAASQAVMAGENLPLIGKLLGHRRHRTTAGYAHVADDHLVEAAEKVGNAIAAAMTNRPQPM